MLQYYLEISTPKKSHFKKILTSFLPAPSNRAVNSSFSVWKLLKVRFSAVACLEEGIAPDFCLLMNIGILLEASSVILTRPARGWVSSGLLPASSFSSNAEGKRGETLLLLSRWAFPRQKVTHTFPFSCLNLDPQFGSAWPSGVGRESRIVQQLRVPESADLNLSSLFITNGVSWGTASGHSSCQLLARAAVWWSQLLRGDCKD